ncbi:MAG TPA: cytochrome c [Steroidobacteraceae bacterium]
MRSLTLFVLLVAVIVAGCASTQPRHIESLSGMELYQRLCSSCHGVEGRGDGPVAPLLKVNTPDLTRIAARDGGEFPTEDVRRIIDGRTDRRAHGPRDMPVWGWQLYDMSTRDGNERARADAMIDRLVEYLRSIQRP